MPENTFDKFCARFFFLHLFAEGKICYGEISRQLCWTYICVYTYVAGIVCLKLLRSVVLPAIFLWLSFCFNRRTLYVDTFETHKNITLHLYSTFLAFLFSAFSFKKS